MSKGKKKTSLIANLIIMIGLGIMLLAGLQVAVLSQIAKKCKRRGKVTAVAAMGHIRGGHQIRRQIIITVPCPVVNYRPPAGKNADGPLRQGSAASCMAFRIRARQGSARPPPSGKPNPVWVMPSASG